MWSRRSGRVEASSPLLAVSSAATMNPSSSTPMCSFRQSRRFLEALYLCAFHSPEPRILSPGIDDQADRAVVVSGQGRHLNGLVPARECGVVRGLEIEAHQAEQRVQEALGLPKRQAEDDPQRQRGQNSELRVPSLASAQTVLRRCPRAIACSLSQIVTSPRLLRPRSYSLQFRILYVVLYLLLTRLDFRAAMASLPRPP